MGLAEEKYMSLTTYRKVGTPVASPVWVIDLGDDKVGFYTSSGSGKAKRLAHTSKVIVQPSDSRGRAKAGTEPIEATAELVTDDQLAEITAKVRAKYGWFTKVTKLLGTIGGIIKRNRIPYADRGVVITLPPGVA
jgi:PPOX class probable F420-dependent enzyme